MNDDAISEVVFDDNHFQLVLENTDNRLSLRIAGDIDLAIEPKLTAVLVALTELLDDDENDSVVVDMTRVTFCDSTGVAFLLRVQQTASAAGASFSIRGASPIVRRVLGVLALQGLLDNDRD
jgi:anti-sigma B factor antagonist